MSEEDKTLVQNAESVGGNSEDEFVSGTVLANRYRIVALLGRGGMGAVYKAEDLKLAQTVALKFLPDNFQTDPAALERFHSEVRHARQVSHPNVCRVFDIGEIDGRHFISMEFVDGDDLSSLLTRVGRLSSERAVEISRQLCVGLEAIHNAGILHRDFKPANIIIDSKGKARITDFGIAGVEAEIANDPLRAGTPAYMSPEQISGKNVSAKSDIYALGLVLYEIFTGKPAFQSDSIPDLIRKQRTETPTNPSVFVKGIDPLVESVIAACIEKDPKDRPESALHVAMALPGGNPMQMALDAGKTPTPEMIAASPKKGALTPLVAATLLATVVLGIVFVTATSKGAFLHRMVPLEKSPEVLSQRSRELVEKFGYRVVDSYSAFVNESGYVDFLRENDPAPERWQKLSTAQPAVTQFWYRSSPEPLVPVGNRKVTFSDPENTVPGMARLRLDTKGRLIFFGGVPPRIDEPGGTQTEFDWVGVFKEAGFDLPTFERVEPQLTPPQAFDDRRAFSGHYPDESDIAIRVEAAAYRGKLVSLEIVEPWTVTPGQTSHQSNSLPSLILLSIYFGVLVVSAWLAAKNIRQGRSDVKGAFRVAIFIFAARMIIWAFATHHVGSFSEGTLLVSGLQAALYWAGMAGFIYLAFEPYLRRSAPERIISWTRLLAGAWRDPLVGRDILIGGAAAMVISVVMILLTYVFPTWQGRPMYFLIVISGQGPGSAIFTGPGGFPDMFLDKVTESLLGAFIFMFLLLFFSLLLRRKWLGTAAVCLLAGGLFLPGFIAQGQPAIELAAYILFIPWTILLASRFGVLAFISYLVFADFVNRPITSDLTAWYASEFILFALALLVLAVFGFYTSTAGQKLWKGKLFAES
ncbi:MAG: serine/threonine-protein kinase [Pyrinomonadaceae bacterium]